MKRALLGLAAATLVAAPAAGQMNGTSSFGPSQGEVNHSPGAFTGRPAPGGGERNRMGRHGRGVVPWGYVGYGGYGYADDSSFAPDNGNDWWNDRPDRAFPRWVWRNQDCKPDRMWWSGAGWRCTP